MKKPSRPFWSAWPSAGCLLFLLAVAGRAESFSVKSVAEAAAAAKAVKAGDEIVLEDGDYRDLRMSFTAQGSADQPIRVRARHTGGAVLIDSPYLRLAGSYLSIEGLIFRGCELSGDTKSIIDFDGGSHDTLLGCTFNESMVADGAGIVTLQRGASDNRITSNQFLRTRYRAIVVTVDQAGAPPLRNRIDHNFFQDIPARDDGEAEAIQLGQQGAPLSDLRLETVISENRFERCQGGAEIISVRASGNTLRDNQFRDCRGELALRFGEDNTVSGNRIDFCAGGIRISGARHTVTDNTVTDCATGIRLLCGDDSPAPAFPPVTDCVIRGNAITDCPRIGLIVGDEKKDHPVTPTNNQILQNTITGPPRHLLDQSHASGNFIISNILVPREIH